MVYIKASWRLDEDDEQASPQVRQVRRMVLHTHIVTHLEVGEAHLWCSFAGPAA